MEESQDSQAVAGRQERYAIPALGHRLVSEITISDVNQVLEPILKKERPKYETARQVREHLSAIMEWAISHGFRVDNPTARVALPKAAGKKQPIEHFKALPYSELGEAIEQVRGTAAWLGTKLCFELLALTATRSGEARLARWDEFDLETETRRHGPSLRQGGRMG